MQTLLLSLIYLMFFLSGAAALMYEVIWVRSLSLIFGGTHLAVTSVLSVFMAGLAIGSHVIGRYGYRKEKTPPFIRSAGAWRSSICSSIRRVNKGIPFYLYTPCTGQGRFPALSVLHTCAFCDTRAYHSYNSHGRDSSCAHEVCFKESQKTRNASVFSLRLQHPWCGGRDRSCRFLSPPLLFPECNSEDSNFHERLNRSCEYSAPKEGCIAC